jgi:hypothetical protein
MTIVRLGDFCCQAGDRLLDLTKFRFSRKGPLSKYEDLVLSNSAEKSEFIFSPLGHHPDRPRLALVGITPGARWAV